MNPDSPNSVENQLLDELIHEQNQAPDLAFLQQIEAALDSSPQVAVKPPKFSASHRYGLAAAIAVTAGAVIWWQAHLRRQNHPVVLTHENRNIQDSATPQNPVSLNELKSAIQNQEDKVEERRKVLSTIARTKGIIYRGDDSFFNSSGVDEDQGAKSALQTFHDLEQEKMQLESQISSLKKFDDDQLMNYAGGIDLPDNSVRELYPQYQEAKREAERMKSEGYGDSHPALRQKQEETKAMKRNLEEGVVNLRETMKARLDLASDRLKNVEIMKDETREEAIKRGLDAQDYVDAKRDFEIDQQQLMAMKMKLIELGGDLKDLERKAAPVNAPAEAPVTDPAPVKAKVLARPLPMPSEVKPEPPSSDRYQGFIDQPWKRPIQDPQSTFSIDVDTASYSNVRRMIREGREIPRNAVRIEDCINAFRYHYEAPKDGGAFAVGAAIAECPWKPDHQLVRVAIKGREFDPQQRPASNLVFLIDVSGSMQSPDKLPLLKQSMATLVKQLDERDRVAIVVYAGSEGVVLPSTRLDSAGRSLVLDALAKLEAGGSTNGGAGIQKAYEMAMKEKIDGGVNRVILATDGDFNVGTTGQQSLVDMVKERAGNGVYLTVLGYGTGNLNDAMMDAITRDGNGNYFYIDSERENSKVFSRNLAGTLVTIAKDVKIQIEFNPAKVGGYRLIGYSSRILKNEDFHNDKVDAGDIGAGHTVTAFYEIAPPSPASGDALKYQGGSGLADEWLSVKLRHKHPDGDESRLTEFSLKGKATPLAQTEADFQFATAAALFGMKLRGMDEVKGFGWDRVIELAKPGLKDDASEDRAEFVELMRTLSGTRDSIVPAPAEVMPNQR